MKKIEAIKSTIAAVLKDARVHAFAATLLISLSIEHVLPTARRQRQRLFAEASMTGDTRQMRALRFSGADINARGNCCMPLYLAAGEGKIDAVRYLLNEGADVNAREKFGGTPLTEAAFHGHLNVVNELLFHNADVNAISREGTALDMAARKHYLRIAELLEHHGAKRACDVRKCD